MNITIGNRIKALRKQKALTQEQLADAIGISFQAVSKWENNIALPDIALVPSLASFFGVTIDELFDYNLKEMRENIKKITDEAYKYRQNEPGMARAILEDGLSRYPDNDILLNNLLYVMNSADKPDETLEVASRLIAQTNDSEVKYDALRFLAYAYNAKGDTQAAVAAMEQIPELYFTKLSELAFILTGEAKRKVSDKQKWISFEILLQMMQKLAEVYQADGEIDRAVAELERAIAAIDAVCDSDMRSRFQIYIDFFGRQIEKIKK